jgi:hypothetical protein
MAERLGLLKLALATGGSARAEICFAKWRGSA